MTFWQACLDGFSDMLQGALYIIAWELTEAWIRKCEENPYNKNKVEAK